MKTLSILSTVLLSTVLTACGGHHDPDGHSHGPDGEHEHPEPEEPSGGHEHPEESIGTVAIGDLAVELAQGHGAVAPGKEAHLVVKLPAGGAGATVVRAWIGTEDRTSSYVGKGEYDADHDQYDLHATAPDPLPEGALWWIELEQPDGTKLVGSAQPLLE